LSVKSEKRSKDRKNELVGCSVAMPDLDILVMMRLPQRPCMEFMSKSKIVFIFNQESILPNFFLRKMKIFPFFVVKLECL
jgi:hypothetical protein